MAEIFDQYLPPLGAPLLLRASDKAFLRSTVNPAPSPTADLVFTLCRIDATPVLQSSSDEPGTGETAATVGPLCTRCQQAQANNPVLFAAVVRITSASRFLWLTLDWSNIIP